MARKLLKDTCEIAAEILDGKHDENLSYIIQAAQGRTKRLFRKGQRVTITQSRDAEMVGKVGVVLKVNPKTISVGVGDTMHDEWDKAKAYPVFEFGEWNFPATCLAPVSA